MFYGRPIILKVKELIKYGIKEIKKYIYNKYLENKENFNLNKVLVEIINIHNNKKYSITEEITKNYT